MNKAGLFLFLLSVFLSAIGIFVLYESSTYVAQLELSDKYFFIRYQLLWLSLGIILCLVISKIDLKLLHNLALPALVASLVLLILVFIPGIGLELKGANRWIDLRFVIMQPSEVLKISLTLYLAAWLSRKEKSRAFAFLILFVVCVVLVALEPDVGTAFIIAATSFIVYFLSGAGVREIILIFAILTLGFFFLIKIEPYRMARLTSFLNLNTQKLENTSYHTKQILISLGSGGLTGVGIGRSTQKYGYLPEATTDSIFSIFSEEVGFIGAALLLAIFSIHLFLGFLIAGRARDKFERLLAAGIITFIGIQTLMNISSQVVLIPLTGVPLPFISSGGSSMIINFSSIGILMNIARRY